MTSDDATTGPETGVSQPVRGRASASKHDVFDVLYGFACWILFCVLGTLVWPVLLVLPKLSWRWKLTRAAAQLLCACLDIAF